MGGEQNHTLSSGQRNPKLLPVVAKKFGIDERIVAPGPPKGHFKH